MTPSRACSRWRAVCGRFPVRRFPVRGLVGAVVLMGLPSRADADLAPPRWSSQPDAPDSENSVRCLPPYEETSDARGALSISRNWATRTVIDVLTVHPADSMRHPYRWAAVELDSCYQDSDPHRRSRAYASVVMLVSRGPQSELRSRTVGRGASVVKSIAASSTDARVDTGCLERALTQQWSEPVRAPAVTLRMEIRFETYCHVFWSQARPGGLGYSSRAPDHKAHFRLAPHAPAPAVDAASPTERPAHEVADAASPTASGAADKKCTDHQ